MVVKRQADAPEPDRADEASARVAAAEAERRAELEAQRVENQKKLKQEQDASWPPLIGSKASGKRPPSTVKPSDKAHEAGAIGSGASSRDPAPGRDGGKQDGPLALLCGEWRDRRGSSYALEFDGPNSLSVLTTRASGQRITTSRLIRLTPQGVTWGAQATYQLDKPIKETSEEIAWRRCDTGKISFV